ncbi:MAG: polymorphic toxin-type HINT domain-containing protein [Oleispira sp.]
MYIKFKKLMFWLSSLLVVVNTSLSFSMNSLDNDIKQLKFDTLFIQTPVGELEFHGGVKKGKYVVESDSLPLDLNVIGLYVLGRYETLGTGSSRYSQIEAYIGSNNKIFGVKGNLLCEGNTGGSSGTSCIDGNRYHFKDSVHSNNTDIEVFGRYYVESSGNDLASPANIADWHIALDFLHNAYENIKVSYSDPSLHSYWDIGASPADLRDAEKPGELISWFVIADTQSNRKIRYEYNSSLKNYLPVRTYFDSGNSVEINWSDNQFTLTSNGETLLIGDYQRVQRNLIINRLEDAAGRRIISNLSDSGFIYTDKASNSWVGEINELGLVDNVEGPESTVITYEYFDAVNDSAPKIKSISKNDYKLELHKWKDLKTYSDGYSEYRFFNSKRGSSRYSNHLIMKDNTVRSFEEKSKTYYDFLNSSNLLETFSSRSQNILLINNKVNMEMERRDDRQEGMVWAHNKFPRYSSSYRYRNAGHDGFIDIAGESYPNWYMDSTKREGNAKGSTKNVFDFKHNVLTGSLIEYKDKERNYSFEVMLDEVSHLASEVKHYEGIDEDRQVLFTEKFTYNDANHIDSITETNVATNASRVYQYFYDDYQRLVKEIDPEGHVIEYKDFHASGRPQTKIDERKKVWKYEYDNSGNMTSWQDPKNDKIILGYDDLGRFNKKTKADGSVFEMKLNGSGEVIEEIDELGHVTKFERNLTDKITKVTEPSDDDVSPSRTYRFEYNQERLLDKEILPGGEETKYEYSGLTLTAINYPTLRRQFGFDNYGRVNQEVLTGDDGERRQREKLLDPLDHVKSETDGEGNSYHYEYDIWGNITKVTDALEQTTQYQWDGWNNLVKIIDPQLKTFNYEYDRNNRLTKETRHNGQTREFEYYPTGELKKAINANGNVAVFKVNDIGETVAIIHYANNEDALAESSPLKSYEFRYNNRGLMEYSNDGQVAYTYGYNKRNELTSVEHNYGAFSKQQSYDYYPNGNLKSYTNPENITYEFVYNLNNDLQAIKIPSIGQLIYSNYEWHIPNQILYPGGSKVDLTSNGLRLLTGMSLTDSADNLIATNIYEYNKEGYPSAIETTSQSTASESEAASASGGESAVEISQRNSLGYDENYRLTSALDNTYSYDSADNRLTVNGGDAWVYNDNHQLVEANGLVYRYDGNGSLTRIELPSMDNSVEAQVIRRYFYDSSERLIRIEQGEETLAEYGYDYQARRIWKSIKGEKTYFLYNQSGLAAEYNSAGELITEYFYDPQQSWGVMPLFNRQNDQLYYYQNDLRNAPERMIDGAGNLVWQAEYDAFGYATIVLNDVNNPIRLPGQYFDEESGLHYNWNRYYDPSLGRYITEDPLGVSGGGINLYSYVSQSPYAYVDPQGLFCLDWTDFIPGAGPLKLIGKAVGAIGRGISKAAGKGRGKGRGDNKNDKNNKDNPCGKGCFADGTQIITDKGLKSIEQLVAGDQVLAKNVATGEQGYKAVKELFVIAERPLYQLVLQHSETNKQTLIEVTDDHPFWVDEFGWLETINLVPGLAIETRDNDTLTVIDVKYLNKVETVYNLEVSDWHTYYVGDEGVLVHNCEDTNDPGKKIDNCDLCAPPNKRGNAPTGNDGYPVELHHRNQKPDGPLDEMTQTDHRRGDNFKKNHPNTGQKPSKIDRNSWRKEQKDYWKNEWDSGRFDNM